MCRDIFTPCQNFITILSFSMILFECLLEYNANLRERSNRVRYTNAHTEPTVYVQPYAPSAAEI